jgi:hypothetical protein
MRWEGQEQRRYSSFGWSASISEPSNNTCAYTSKLFYWYEAQLQRCATSSFDMVILFIIYIYVLFVCILFLNISPPCLIVSYLSTIYTRTKIEQQTNCSSFLFCYVHTSSSIIPGSP